MLAKHQVLLDCIDTATGAANDLAKDARRVDELLAITQDAIRSNLKYMAERHASILELLESDHKRISDEMSLMDKNIQDLRDQINGLSGDPDFQEVAEEPSP